MAPDLPCMIFSGLRKFCRVYYQTKFPKCAEDSRNRLIISARKFVRRLGMGGAIRMMFSGGRTKKGPEKPRYPIQPTRRVADLLGGPPGGSCIGTQGRGEEVPSDAALKCQVPTGKNSKSQIPKPKDEARRGCACAVPTVVANQNSIARSPIQRRCLRGGRVERSSRGGGSFLGRCCGSGARRRRE